MATVRTRGGGAWLDSPGDWAWPGRGGSMAPLGPAAWVPALPLVDAPPAAPPAVRRRRHTLPRALRLARLVLLLFVAGATFVVSSGIWRPFSGSAVATPAAPLRFVPALSSPFAAPSALLADALTHARPLAAVPPVALPDTVPVSSDAAGSTIARISYPSQALGWRDTFLVYLPPGYVRSPGRRYPVLYLLHGDNQPASSFLRLGLQPTLDRLIATHRIAPLIAVMLQANGLPNSWLDTARAHYGSYVVEVPRVVDRVLRTIPNRDSRAIAGYSMGGFGAMHAALTNLRTYSVVESWEGYFNNLAAQLHADRALLKRLPLHAFVYGGLQDAVASPAEDDPWAAALRAAGAWAHAATYPGSHDFAMLEAHLAHALTYAGRALRS